MKKFHHWLHERTYIEAREAAKITGDNLMPGQNGGYALYLPGDPDDKSPIIDIKATNYKDDEIPGNRLFVLKTQRASYALSMNGRTAKEVLTTFYKKPEKSGDMYAKFSKERQMLGNQVKRPNRLA